MKVATKRVAVISQSLLFQRARVTTWRDGMTGNPVWRGAM
jgi:hypothetical protein